MYVLIICFDIASMFFLQIWWELASQQHWMLWPCDWQLGSGDFNGNTTLWCRSLCS